MLDFKTLATLMIVLASGLAIVGCSDTSEDAAHDRVAQIEPRASASASNPKPSASTTLPAVPRSPPTTPRSPLGSVTPPKLTVQEISKLIGQGDYERADAVIRSMLSADPTDASLLFMAARSAHGQDRLDEAIESLKLIPPDHPEAGFAAMGQTADWLLQAERLAEAETVFEAMLQQYGDLAPVHRRLADLLNSQARRVEAAQHVEALIELGDVTEKELLSLTTLSVPYHDELRGKQERVIADTSAPPLAITMRDLARAKEMLVQSDLDPAKSLVGRLRAKFPQSTAVAALEGRVYEAMQRDEDLRSWSQSLPPGIENEAEYWASLGAWMLRSGKPDPAIRAFCEAITLDPTDRVCYLRLSEALAAIGETQAAQRVAARKSLLDDAWQLALNVGLHRETRAADMKSLAEKLDQLGRPWEAVSWRMVLAHEAGRLEDAMPELITTRQSLAQSSAGATPRDLLCGIDKSRWPLPDDSNLPTGSARNLTADNLLDNPAKQRAIELVDVAADLGIDFRYHHNREQDISHVRMSQVNGGGIAAIDYDRDGWPDLYFCDAGGRANDANDSNPNRLYRNLSGKEMKNVAAAAGTADRSYSLGTTSTDWNQDGFIDLVVANIGENLLYINNGDGTFTARIIDGSGGWTSGIVCGDLDGDALPEMVEINYIDDEHALTAKCWGEGIDCTPRAFEKATNRILTGGAQGHCLPSNALESEQQQASFGFAGLIANFDRKAGNDLFVANDTLDNFMGVSKSSSAGDHTYLSPEATLRGCAVGDTGQPQGSMGCTGGDFDRDGNLDLCVTNYWNEPSNLYLQRIPGFFTDSASQFGIADASRATVGFGIQAVDLDRDGWLDLTVLNGHVFDPAENGTPEIPFRMLPQLFQGGPGGFTLVDPPEPATDKSTSPFWTKPTLGRTLIRTDFNGDGEPDLVANSLDSPVAVLENRTDGRNWLRIDLVGTESERDAIGAEVIATCGEQTFHSWMLAGGYMGANEATVDMGLGDFDQVDQLEIRWPSGKIQSFANVAADAHYLAIENEEHLHVRYFDNPIL